MPLRLPFTLDLADQSTLQLVLVDIEVSIEADVRTDSCGEHYLDIHGVYLPAKRMDGCTLSDDAAKEINVLGHADAVFGGLGALAAARAWKDDKLLREALDFLSDADVPGRGGMDADDERDFRRAA